MGEWEQGDNLGGAGADGGGSSRPGGVFEVFKASDLLCDFTAFSGWSSDSGIWSSGFRWRWVCL